MARLTQSGLLLKQKCDVFLLLNTGTSASPLVEGVGVRVYLHCLLVISDNSLTELP